MLVLVVVGALVLLEVEVVVRGRAQASGMRTTERRSCGRKAKDVYREGEGEAELRYKIML